MTVVQTAAEADAFAACAVVYVAFSLRAREVEELVRLVPVLVLVFFGLLVFELLVSCLLCFREGKCDWLCFEPWLE